MWLVCRNFGIQPVTSGSNGDDSFRAVGEDRRLDRLDAELDRLQQVEASRTTPSRRSADANERMGNRVLADLIGGIAGGALLGWLADRILGTAPWGLLILLFLGIVVAFRNIFRLTNGGKTSGVIVDSGPGIAAAPNANNEDD